MLRLSNIVPALTEAAGIERTLSGLHDIRARSVEIIVADGGSSDGTPDIALPFSDLVLTAPRGRGRQMNAGAARASGDVLLFLHADCALPADADCIIVKWDPLESTCRHASLSIL